MKNTKNARLTDAKDDSVDVHSGEVEEEEGEVYNEEREAQNHTDPLLESLSYRDNKHIMVHENTFSFHCFKKKETKCTCEMHTKL